MRIAIRTDSSARIGSGHLVRCLTLAKLCRRLGAQVTFFCADLPGNLSYLVKDEGFGFHDLPVAGFGDDGFWQSDAAAFVEAARKDRDPYDWLVVDHYQLDRKWELTAAVHAKHIMVIDDLADRPHAASVLLDQNLIAGADHRYDDLVSPICVLLLGPGYALMQDTFRLLRDQVHGRPRTSRVVVYFGASDPHGLTAKSLIALLQLEHPVDIDIVLGPHTANAESIRTEAARHLNVSVHSMLPSLAPLLANAELAIGGSGATNWERLSLAVPTITAILAENQRAIDEELVRRDAVLSLGDAQSVTSDQILEQLEAFFTGRERLVGAGRLSNIIDGWGSTRVAHALLFQDAEFKLRPANQRDEMQLFDWANDPDVRSSALNPDQIPLASHKLWFSSRLQRSDSCRIYIAELDGQTALGYVRFELQQETWTISYALDRDHRGKKLGRRLLSCGVARLFDDVGDVELLAQVRQHNQASLRVFQQLGFDRADRADDPVIFTGRTGNIRILGDTHV